jgi:nucleoside-diphosphate-sugar epimerase
MVLRLKILVTGANGFVGKNLVAELKIRAILICIYTIGTTLILI